jgi:hypothetical protein
MSEKQISFEEYLESLVIQGGSQGLAAREVLEKGSPDQPRDDHGRFAGGSGGGDSANLRGVVTVTNNGNTPYDRAQELSARARDTANIRTPNPTNLSSNDMKDMADRHEQLSGDHRSAAVDAPSESNLGIAHAQAMDDHQAAADAWTKAASSGSVSDAAAAMDASGKASDSSSAAVVEAY